MVDDPFSVESAWNITLPCYVRKVDRAGHWPLDGESEQERIDEIERKVFGYTSGGKISVFHVRDNRDLRRVVVGLAARSRGRRGHFEDIRLVAITSAELVHIRKSVTDGNTYCIGANRLHRDLAGPDSPSLRSMIQRMLLSGRKPKNFRKKKIEREAHASKEEGCYAADPDSAHCDCEEETRHRITWWGVLNVIGLLAASVAIFAPKLVF